MQILIIIFFVHPTQPPPLCQHLKILIHLPICNGGVVHGREEKEDLYKINGVNKSFNVIIYAGGLDD